MLSRALCLLPIAALLAFAACSKPAAPQPPAGAQRYELRGTVVSVNPSAREVFLKHEEIPGYMAAMTMPFYVATPEELMPFKPGDRVVGELLVWDSGALVRGLRTSEPARPEAAP